MVRDACGIVSAKPDLSGATSDEVGLWIVPDAMSLASFIGLDRKGTRPIRLAKEGG